MSQVSIHDLAARQAIENVPAPHGRGVDRADAELPKSIFQEDATVLSGVINGSGAEFADWSSNQPSALKFDGFYADPKNRGCRGREEPVYAIWDSFQEGGTE